MTRRLTSPTINLVNSKILLVYEEYSEMMNTQALLQKVGFDVLGISTEYTLSENVLSFNPDVVVAFGRAGKVTTIGAGRRLREMTRWSGKVILILPAGYKPNPQDFAKIRADMLLEAPIPGLRLMQVLGKMLGYDEALLQERLAKHGNEINVPSGGIGVAGTLAGQEEETQFVVGSAPEKEESEFLTGSPQEEEESQLLANKTMSFDHEPVKDKPQFGFDISPEPAGKPARKSDQDLEALWTELTESSEIGITPEEDAAAKRKVGKKVSFDLEDHGGEFSQQELEDVARKIQSARNSEAERVSKYAKFTAKIADFDPRQSLSKIASRKVQKEIAKGWNHTEIEGQDKARQEFTKALFRKK